jgi:hypothetical protein
MTASRALYIARIAGLIGRLPYRILQLVLALLAPAPRRRRRGW